MIYTVDFARANSVLAQIESIDKQITSMLTSLEQDSQRNLAEWQSDARQVYQETKARWDASAARMPQLLGQARVALNEIITNYQRAEKSNGSDYSGAVR